MNVAELMRWFEAWADPCWQESWDNCGWQIEPGILDQEARALVCLTPTLAVMEEAIGMRDQGNFINLIFAHHPLIFSPLKTIRKGDPIGDMVRLSFTHGIGVYSAHTNFDQVADGTADVLAQLLELRNSTPVVSTQPGLGYGRVGDLFPPLSLEELLELIQEKLSPPDLIFSPAANLAQTINKVAVLGGSGASFLGDVAQTGAQAYLTSDCKFHQFQEGRDLNVVLIDAGHYATERPACDRLSRKLREAGAAWVGLSQQDEDFRQFYRC